MSLNKQKDVILKATAQHIFRVINSEEVRGSNK